MRHVFFHRMQWLLLMGILMGLGGCATLAENMPTPAFLAGIDFKGPYDEDIPAREAKQIKRASLMAKWAVPYIFINIAAHFESTGDPVRSLHYFDRAIDEFRKHKNVSGEGTAFSRKVSSLCHFGKIQVAYHAIVEQEKKWSHPPFNAFIFYNYGAYHLRKGDYAKAGDYFKQVLAVNVNDADNADLLALRRDTEMGYGTALILADYFPAVSRGLCLTDFDEAFYKTIRRNVPEGLFHLERVPALNNLIMNTGVIRYFPGMIPSFLESDLYNYLGLSYGMAGKMREAVKHLEKAADFARKTNYRLGEADSIFFLNQVYLLDKNRRRGIKSAQDLEGIANRFQLSTYSIWAKMILAHHHKAAGDVDPLMAALNDALTLMEKDVSWLPGEGDFRAAGFFNRQVIYEVLLDLLAGKDEREAFKTAERAKAAMLADWLSGVVVGKKPAVVASIKQVRFYHKQLREHYTRLLSSANAPDVFLNTVEKMSKARSACADELVKIKKQDEILYSLMSSAPPDAANIQQLLDHHTTLFAYYVGEKHLYVWVISKNGFHQEKIGMFRDDVDRLVHAYRRAVMSKDKNQANAFSEKVYDAFLKPTIPFVSGDRMIIAPHGALYHLPFASMRYVKAYLVDGFTISYLPNAGMLKRIPSQRAMPQAKKVAVFANPQRVERQQPVARAEAELSILKKVFPQADYYVSANASKANLQNLPDTYDLIHFAAECYFNEETPLESGLLLAATGQGNGHLSVHDIVRLQVGGRAMVLSDCRTRNGLPSTSTGAGVLAMTGAWLYAVSPSVITSLWRIEDKSRAAMVGLFYKNLAKSGNMGDSLKLAQNEMIQMGYGPSDWAAFVLTGCD